jgi:flagellin
MNSEFAEMAAEVERIATSTKFNDITMLDNEDSVSIQFGGSTDAITVSGADMTKEGLGIETGSGGTTIESLTANGVDAVTDTWLTLTDADDPDTITLTIQFTGEEAIEVDFTADAAGEPYSLQDVVDAINLVSQNLGNDAEGNSLNYTAAEAVLDASSGKYVLKLNSRTSGADGVTMTLAEGDATNNCAPTGGFDSLGDVTGDMQEADTDAAGLNILTTTDAVLALTTITTAITAKDAARASFGYKMNRLESSVGVLNIQAENLMASESRISDVDVATEMAELTRNQVLAQAGTSMLAQANAIPQMALTLLR